MNAERIIEELENICYNNEYILELLSKLKNSIPICPLPCVRDEHGEIKKQNIKMLLIVADISLRIRGWACRGVSDFILVYRALRGGVICSANQETPM